MKICSAVLVSAFGQGRKHPRRATIQKLILLSIISLILGGALAYNARTTNVPRWPPNALLFFAITLGVQILTTASFMGSRTIISQQNTINRLLVILPLGRMQRWRLTWIPQFVMIAYTFIAILPALFVIGRLLGIANYQIIGAILIGTASSCGMVFGGAITYLRRTLVAACTIGIEIWLTKHSISIVYSLHRRMPYIIAQATILLVLCSGMVHITNGVPSNKQHVWLPSGLLSSGHWFIAKLLRSYTGSRSLLYAFLMSILVALAGMNIPGVTAALLYEAAALLVASCTADIRSISRINKPPEILGIKGVGYFCSVQFASVCFACMSALPIIAVAVHSALANNQIIWGSLEIIIGGAVGNVAGTLFAHEGRDISSQFVGILLSMGLLWCIQTVLSLSSKPPPMQCVEGLSCIAVLAAIAFAIEYHRNPFVWRKRNE